MFVVIHDATHNCIFKANDANKWVAIFCRLAEHFPTAMGFRCYHMKHHSHLGDYHYDADLPSRWEANLFGKSALGKAAWMFLFPVFQITRLGRLKGTVPMWSRWTFINAGCVFLFDLIILLCFGPNALFYLFASFWFSVGGLHPLGARWLQEHFTSDPAQETFGYYGPLNLIALNIGYHNEHHDFPDVPWSRLPQLKRMAPEYYDGLKTHKSWAIVGHVYLRPAIYIVHTGRSRRWALRRPPIACLVEPLGCRQDIPETASSSASVSRFRKPRKPSSKWMAHWRR